MKTANSVSQRRMDANDDVFDPKRRQLLAAGAGLGLLATQRPGN